LSHAGSSNKSTDLIAALLKEFLSSVRELEIRISVGKTSMWWDKSNYVSTLNLIPTINLLGPLSNYWDGGGKGERYIQEIKPHIPRGIRDGHKFFVSMLERVYRFDCIKQVEKSMMDEEGVLDGSIKLKDGEGLDDQSSQSSISSNSTSSKTENEDPSNLNEEMKEECQSNHSDQSSDDSRWEADEWTTPMESEQMDKARTFYVYKNEAILQQAYAEKAPISGVLISLGDAGLSMFVMFRSQKSKCLCWKKITFLDNSGVKFFGMWYAPLIMSDTDKTPPASKEQLTKWVKMATMAIPLKCAVESKFMESQQNKYCVITNWWRERDQHGKYCFPSLSFEYYAESDKEDTNTDP
jgi:hypothetical protein